ncbi:hypothetical protein GGR95_002967 [Sulfitobacter undariae]|uniref:Uncharacterized protein n=1 Tax=Sulfitobacter undariae TaxID=1563671 RepID=A0A7W6H1K9_9RHOB|nr:hypothetical protein [Sulfitobacter undariae]MBB3995312.1 hypothetical protein [Sulfitobacter undariae]
MNVFPEGFDPRADVVLKIDLVSIDTPDGPFGFVLGADGRFVDINGRTWWGSQLIAASALEMAINGTAPSGELSMTFFQDPDAPDLVNEVRRLGVEYVAGREITFYEQYFMDHAEMYAPVYAPSEVLRRRMRSIRIAAEGDQQRTIALLIEGPFADRRNARRRVYNSTDHSAVVGSANPSLDFIPRDVNFKEKLWG